MLQQQVVVINAILMAVDAICVILAGYGGVYFRHYYSGQTWSININDFVVSVLFIMFLNNYFSGTENLYSDRRTDSFRSLVWSLFKVNVITFAALMAGMFILKNEGLSRLFILSFAVLTFLLLLAHRVAAQFYLNRKAKGGFNAHNIAVAADKERAKIVEVFLEQQLSWGHKMVGRIGTLAGESGEDIIGHIDDLAQTLRIKTIDEVIFALDGDRHVDLRKSLELCRRVGVEVRILPALWQPGEGKIAIEQCQDMPFLTMRATNINATDLLYKRIIDFLGGLAGACFFLVIYPFIAAAIKWDSPGPVLFKQRRIGQHGREFNLFKFRSMGQDAEQLRSRLFGKNQMQGQMFKIEDDPRITKVGSWLRKTSLDEVPQFLNVLRGEMILVGTRPPLQDEVDQYHLEHLKRIASKPGITGLWQISGRNKIEDFEKVVELDCRYMESWCLLDDLKIIFKTIIVVLQRKGAV